MAKLAPFRAKALTQWLLQPSLARLFTSSSRTSVAVKLHKAGHDEEAIFRENRKQREDLAIAYRSMEKYNMHEGVCNHLTALAPSLKQDEPVMLLVPYGYYWGDVTPECFIGLNVHTAKVIEGEGVPERTAHCIHRSIYQQRADIRSIMHTHARYSTVLANLKDPVMKPINQNNARYLRNVAYDANYGEVASDANDEGKRLATVLEGKEVLVMGNHGLLTVADSVAVAFDLHYYFEKAAMTLVLTYMTGKELSFLSPTAAESIYADFQKTKGFYADKHFEGLRRTLTRNDSTFLSTLKS